eukprot:SAG31_NODE_7294_length_1729_cov_1.662577_2_plen_344_part_00
MIREFERDQTSNKEQKTNIGRNRPLSHAAAGGGSAEGYWELECGHRFDQEKLERLWDKQVREPGKPGRRKQHYQGVRWRAKDSEFPDGVWEATMQQDVRRHSLSATFLLPRAPSESFVRDMASQKVQTHFGYFYDAVAAARAVDEARRDLPPGDLQLRKFHFPLPGETAMNEGQPTVSRRCPTCQASFADLRGCRLVFDSESVRQLEPLPHQSAERQSRPASDGPIKRARKDTCTETTELTTSNSRPKRCRPPVDRFVASPGIARQLTNRPEVTANRPEVTANRPEVTANRPEVTANRPEVTANRPNVTMFRKAALKPVNVDTDSWESDAWIPEIGTEVECNK